MKTLPVLTRVTACTAILLSSYGLALSSAPSLEERLKATDHKNLGKALGAYIEAKTEREGIQDAKEEVADVLEKAAKKAKVDDPLVLVEDLEVALFLAKDYSDKGIKKGKVQDYEEPIFEGANFERTLEYAIWTPKAYKASKGSYPLILAFPDEPSEDATPKAHIDEHWSDPDLRNEFVIACPAMPEDVDDWAVLGDSWEGGLSSMMMLMRMVLEDMAIDVERIYIAGRGNSGVASAVELALLYPDRFAGIIGRKGDMAGAANPVNLRHVQSLFAGGGANCTAFAEQVESLGWSNCTIDPAADEKAVYEWMKGVERQSNPSAVTLSPLSSFSTKAYWVQLDRYSIGEDSRLDAEIDREENTITLTGTGVEAVTLFYNDLLVDLDRPVKVICNGVAHEAKFPRRLETMLDRAFTMNDPGRVYVNYESYDLPIPDGEGDAGAEEE